MTDVDDSRAPDTDPDSTGKKDLESAASLPPPNGSRRRLLRVLAGGLGFFSLGAGKALGRSLLVVEQPGGTEPPRPRTRSVTQTSSFTHSYSESDSYSRTFTESNSVPGSGTYTQTATIDLDGTYSQTFTQTYPPGSQTITVYETTSKSELPTRAVTYTVSYEGTNATQTINWDTGSWTNTIYNTYSATYTVPWWYGASEIDVPDVSPQPELRSVDQRRSVVDPRTRFGNPRALFLGR